MLAVGIFGYDPVGDMIQSTQDNIQVFQIMASALGLGLNDAATTDICRCGQCVSKPALPPVVEKPGRCRRNPCTVHQCVNSGFMTCAVTEVKFPSAPSP